MEIIPAIDSVLEEEQKTSTYKFALLVSIMDYVMENRREDVRDGFCFIPIVYIARQFLYYYHPMAYYGLKGVKQTFNPGFALYTKIWKFISGLDTKEILTGIEGLRSLRQMVGEGEIPVDIVRLILDIRWIILDKPLTYIRFGAEPPDATQPRTIDVICERIPSGAPYKERIREAKKWGRKKVSCTWEELEDMEHSYLKMSVPDYKTLERHAETIREEVIDRWLEFSEDNYLLRDEGAVTYMMSCFELNGDLNEELKGREGTEDAAEEVSPEEDLEELDEESEEVTSEEDIVGQGDVVEPVHDGGSGEIGRVVVQLDLEQIVGQVGVSNLLKHVGIEEIVERVGTRPLVRHIGVEKVVEQVGAGELLSHMKPEDVVEEVGLARILEGVGTGHVLEQIGVGKLLREVGLERVLKQFGVAQVVEQVGVRRVIDQLEVGRIVREVGVERLIEQIGVDQIADHVLGELGQVETGGPDFIDEDDHGVGGGSRGVTEFIEEVGLYEVIEEVGLERVIYEVGVDRLIHEVGTDQLLHEIGVEAVVDEFGTSLLSTLKQRTDDREAHELIERLERLLVAQGL